MPGPFPGKSQKETGYLIKLTFMTVAKTPSISTLAKYIPDGRPWAFQVK